MQVFHHSASLYLYFVWDHLAHSVYYQNQMPVKSMLKGGVANSCCFIETKGADSEEGRGGGVFS